MISGATRVAAVIGDPVRHSLSPRLHNAAYRALGLDWVYVAFEVPDGRAPDAIDAARALGLVGLSVTMPHKTAVASLCDDLTPAAAALRSVNTVTLAPGRVEGDSTDGAGFMRALERDGVDPAGRSVLLLGAGGAARAVALAVGASGAAVLVSARRPEAAAAAAGLAGGEVVPWEDRAATAATVDIVVNATPVGMADDPEAPLPAECFTPAHLVVDLVYHPLETELLRHARARGARVLGGLGMLVQQAALQVERWSGRTAPVDAMQAAVAGAD